MLTLIEQKYQLIQFESYKVCFNKLKQILKKTIFRKRNEFQITIDEVIVFEKLK